AGFEAADVMRHEARARREDRQVAAALVHLRELVSLDRLAQLVVADAQLRSLRRDAAVVQRGDLAVAPVFEGLRRGRVVAVTVDDHSFVPPGPAHTEAGIITSPRMISRAVRSSAARTTLCASFGSSSSSTLNSPLGCSTDTVFARPSGTRAMPSVIVASSTHAVATVTAASTPIASWQTCGMKHRVQTAPPARGAATRHIFG